MANTKFPRLLRHGLQRDLATYPVVAVMGARQVGKSTLCQEIAEAAGYAYCTLDDHDLLQLAREDPEGLLDQLGDSGAFIDEAQRAPELFLAIKAVVDREQRKGRYLLSGSNQPRVITGVAESLLGRAAYRTLRPLTLSELRYDEDHPGWTFLFGETGTVIEELARRAEASGAPDWREVVVTGGFPRAVATDPENRLRLLDDYVKVFASRDIREVVGVDSTDRFESFLRLTATRTGQELNISGISNDIGMPVNTIRRWLEALQRSYLIDLIPPYSRNAGHRVIKASKLFFVDPAFCIAAARESTPTGFHLENLIAIDLLVWKDNAPGREVFHWRLQGGQEVDFVVECRGQLVPIEVKAASSVGRTEARHLRTFRERNDNSPRAILLSCDAEIRELEQGVIAAPWWAVI